MTIYVDKLPKSCKECPFSATTYYWKEDNLEKTLFKINCKLGCSDECCFNSLTDYTKQVRQEVCDKIWKEFEQRLMNKTQDMPIMKVANMINSVLDKIQGETNET